MHNSISVTQKVALLTVFGTTSTNMTVFCGTLKRGTKIFYTGAHLHNFPFNSLLDGRSAGCEQTLHTFSKILKIIPPIQKPFPVDRTDLKIVATYRKFSNMFHLPEMAFFPKKAAYRV